MTMMTKKDLAAKESGGDKCKSDAALGSFFFVHSNDRAQAFTKSNFSLFSWNLMMAFYIYYFEVARCSSTGSF